MKAASTVLTGGLGRRTARQRALILPTGSTTQTHLTSGVCQHNLKPSLCMGVWPNVIKACRITMGTRVNLTYPVFILGSRRERTGHRETRHLQHCA